MLLERLESDKSLRRLCGWEHRYQVPHESVFSRANDEFSESRLPERVHEEALIQTRYAQEVIGHISRDSTAIHAREKAAAKKRGRPRKGEERSKKMTRIDRQAAGMPLAAMLAELPKLCVLARNKIAKDTQPSGLGTNYILMQPMVASPSVACCHLLPCMILKLQFRWHRSRTNAFVICMI